MHRPLTIADFPPPSELVRLGRAIHCFETIDSTNAFLLMHAGGLFDGALAVAEQQSAGRGRLQRTWAAPRGSSVLLSVLLHEATDSSLLRDATLVASLAACRAVEGTTGCRPAVRWPNDLVIGMRKLAGVLAESTPLGGGRRALVIGIGLNCLQQRGHFDGELAERATSLEIESSVAIDRGVVARELVRQLDRVLTRAADVRGSAELREEWRARCEDRGRSVTLHVGHQTHRGTIVDIDPVGDLIVQLDTGERKAFEAATATRHWAAAH
jgi:BirA family biotin operon repressor/biotin-[acetyl-CoA-carboxylase] ligase